MALVSEPLDVAQCTKIGQHSAMSTNEYLSTIASVHYLWALVRSKKNDTFLHISEILLHTVQVVPDEKRSWNQRWSWLHDYASLFESLQSNTANRGTQYKGLLRDLLRVFCGLLPVPSAVWSETWVKMTTTLRLDHTWVIFFKFFLINCSFWNLFCSQCSIISSSSFSSRV